jgi:hypothetical protein
MMLAQQLLADRITIFGHDADQPVDVFCVVPNQFGELSHLRFKVLQSPLKTFLFLRGRLFLGGRNTFFREGRHQHILFHIHPFNPLLESTTTITVRSINRPTADVNGFAFFLFAEGSCYNPAHA